MHIVSPDAAQYIHLCPMHQSNYIVVMQNISATTVLSRGEDIPCGSYSEIYSTHKEVLNFLRGDVLISLCACNISPGPLRLVLSLPQVDCFESLVLDAESVRLSDGQVLSSEGHIYYCRSFSEAVSPPILAKNTTRAYQEFILRCTPDCVLALIKADQSKQRGFSAVLAESFRKGLQHFRQGDTLAGIACFKGRGMGLTPAGDDFMIGMIIAVSWLQLVLKKELSKILHLLKDESKGSDQLVNTFIGQAFALRLNDDWANFLHNLAEPDADLTPSLEKLLSHGASSGADELSGFFVACALYGKIIEI